MTRPIRVLVADDHAILRAGLGLLINAQPDMQVVGEASTGRETLRKAAAAKPDVVILDLTMPQTDGRRTIGELVQMRGAPRVLVLTMHDDPAYLEMALSAGASGFVVKRAADSELLSAIRAVSSGRQFVDATMGGHLDPLRRRKARGRPARRGKDVLSERESEVLRRLAEGHTNRAVALQLGLSVKTVETHRARLSEKLGLRGRADLVRYALQTGLVSAERLGPRHR